MDQISIADLEAELSCFDQESVDVGMLLLKNRITRVPTW